MKKFDFSESIVQQVVDELKKTKSYIKIAIFQIHNDLVIDTLMSKLKEGLDVEILTLPYDSINDDVNARVTKRLKSLEKAGAKLFFDKWNIGDPGRTTTAVGRWYSFHGKFIVTDQAAIALSANFTQNPELDAALVFDGEKAVINEFNQKYEELKNLFVTPRNDFQGAIRQKILDTGNPRAKEVFRLPSVISSGRHDKTWILQYPPEICPDETEVEEKLYLTPFDCKGRSLLDKIISEAEEFLYISSESFTDKQLPNVLKKAKLRNISIKILTGCGSMDFSDRLQIQLKELLAAGVELNTTLEDLHAKLVVTDKAVAIGSMNLNKINLGFKQTANFWRENTESITITRDQTIIREAKRKFERIFSGSLNVIDKIAEKNIGVAGSLFKNVFDSKSSSEAKLFLSKMKYVLEINTEKAVMNVVRIATKISSKLNVQRITKNEVLMALILTYLTDRKHDINDLKEKTEQLIANSEVDEAVSVLMREGYISKEQEFYKLNLDAVL